MSELEKPFLKNQIKKKQKINVEMPHVKKTISDKQNFGLNKKIGLEWTMNGFGKPLRKKLKKPKKRSKKPKKQ